MSQLNVLAISGSLRRDSYNRKALHVAKTIAADAQASVVEADLKELALPMYDADIEVQGFPESVEKLQDLVEKADVLLLASPEYNNSVSGALKNALDWLSRPPRRVLQGKLAVIFGISSGMGGTTRGQQDLRVILRDCDVLVLPKPEILIRSGADAFNGDGSFKDPKTHETLQKLIQKTFRVAQALKYRPLAQ